MIKYYSVLLTIIFLCMLPAQAYSQANEYQRANRYFQQQNYEEALRLFEELYRNNERSLLFFERYVESLIGLKRFDEAEQVVREQLELNRFDLQASLKLAQVLHLSGNKEEALQRWLNEAEKNKNNIQAMYTIGNSLAERKEYQTAIHVYKMAQEALGDDTIFLNELANTHMLAGNFEESVRIFFRLIINSPDQMSLVQQRFLRMRDQNLYEIAAFELEDIMLDLDFNHSAYSPLYQLLVWLLIETEEYQRAFTIARRFEDQTSYSIYSLYTLGNQLRSSQQYKLAAESFNYYLDDSNSSLRARSMEEVAATYKQWAEHLQQKQIESYEKQDDLFSKSYEMYKQIISDYDNYDRIDRVFASITDLSLNHFKDQELASSWLNKMNSYPSLQDTPYSYYAAGRIALFQSDFLQARQYLTRADKSTEESNLSERARYYISLSDIFAGDYEFAEIQLRSLERRSTSYYANEAIKLRMWIKNGMRADSTGSLLNTIGNSLHALQTGNYSGAISTLEPVLATSNHPFADDMVVELKNELPPAYYSVLYNLLNRIIEAQAASPLKERMLWDKITLINFFLSDVGNDLPAYPGEFDFIDTGLQFTFTRNDLVELMENFLIEFPNGFYAPFVREQLQQFSNLST